MEWAKDAASKHQFEGFAAEASGTLFPGCVHRHGPSVQKSGFPTPSSLMKVMPERENMPITMISSRAALVMTPPVRCRPPAMAAVLSPVVAGEGGPCPRLVCLAGAVQVDHPPVVGEQFVN
jgi:hypothetical protein